MEKILFLGYSSYQTSLIKFLRKKYTVVENRQKKITSKVINKYDLILSFGYKKILTKQILSLLKRPAINLHISYLPFNRGAHPNFWSFIDKTPAGVSIHEINEKIDSGKIIARKKVFFRLSKNTTFEDTYQILIKEIEKLFIKNAHKIITKKYNIIKDKRKGSFHKTSDLPKNIKRWNLKIINYLKKLS
jgi:methionyl-tRNA formyltransferase